MKLLTTLTLLLCVFFKQIKSSEHYYEFGTGVFFINSFSWVCKMYIFLINKRFNFKLYLTLKQSDWMESLTECNFRNMTLVEIKSNELYEDVKSAIKKSGSLVPSYWIGLSDITTENEFVWTSSDEKMAFNDFKDDEPNNGGANDTNEDCVVITPKRADGSTNLFGFRSSKLVDYTYEWNDVPCNTLTGFICHAQHPRLVTLLTLQFYITVICFNL